MKLFKNNNNTKKSYVHECQIMGFLYNVELLQTYLIQYANQNLFENEKQTQLAQKHFKKYPYSYFKYEQ
jgi:hypothetical protein